MRTIQTVLLLMAMFSSVVAHAQDASPEQKAKAKELYERAKVHYRSGELEKAAAEFKESYEAFPKPETLFNLAQTHRLLKNYEKAIFYYKQYLSSADVSERDRKTTQERISDLENLLKQQQNAQSAPPQGPEPPSQSAPQAPAQAPPPPTPERKWYTSPLGWSVVGSGVAIVAVSGGVLGVAMSERDKALSATTQMDFDTHHNRSLTFQQAGWPLLAVGGACVVAGGVVLALRAGSHR